MAYNANTNIENERKYLNSLINKGGGYAQWATNQLKELDNFANSMKAPASAAKEVTYYDPTGAIKTGYNIGGKTYLDKEGTQRLGTGNYTNINNKWYMMGQEGGIELPTMPTFRQEMPTLNLPEYKPFEYKDFKYNVDNDDIYKQYAAQFARQGQAAGERALANTAAATGGMPSSYAAAANAQAQQAYAKKTADIIPELEQNAYNRYMNERNFSYQDYLNSFNANTDREKAMYGAALDNIQYIDSRNDLANERDWRQKEFDYTKYLNELDNQFRTDEFNWRKDIDVRDFNYNSGQDAIRNSLSWANHNLSKNRFDYEKEQDELARQDREEQAKRDRYQQDLDANYPNTVMGQLEAREAEAKELERQNNIRAAISSALQAPNPADWLRENAAYLSDEEYAQVIKVLKDYGAIAKQQGE